VRDVIAHLGGTCRGLFNQHAITLVFSEDTEQTNEDLLAPRRAWPTDRVHDEFAHWSKAFIAAASVAVQPLIGSAPLRVGSLGRYPGAETPVNAGIRLAHPPHLRCRPGNQ
jgi:hypothetical protein